MVKIELGNYEAIVTRSTLLVALPAARQFVTDAPSIARKMCQQHVEAMEAALRSLNDGLEVAGFARDEQEG